MYSESNTRNNCIWEKPCFQSFALDSETVNWRLTLIFRGYDTRPYWLAKFFHFMTRIYRWKYFIFILFGDMPNPPFEYQFNILHVMCCIHTHTHASLRFCLFQIHNLIFSLPARSKWILWLWHHWLNCCIHHIIMRISMRTKLDAIPI